MRKWIYFNYMNDLWGYSVGSTVKALKLLGNLPRWGHEVVFEWRRDGVKENSGTDAAKRSLSQRLGSFLRIFLFTPKEVLKNIPDYFYEKKRVEAESVDGIITRLDAFRMSSAFVARRKKLPLVLEADGANSYEWIHYNGGPHLWKWVVLACERFMLRRADAVFVQSAVARDYFVETHKLSPDSIKIITNGADELPPAEPDDLTVLRQSLGISADQRIIGFVGSMHHWHGIANFARHIQDVLQKWPQTVFLFVGGGGAESKALRELQQKTGRLFLPGRVDNADVGTYIQLFDVALAPYPPMQLFYFSPVKIFEYMAAGKAIVAPAMGQIAEILEDDRTALLYEQGNDQNFAEKMNRILKDDELLHRLGKAAKNQFLARHTWSIKSRELYRLLHNLK